MKRFQYESRKEKMTRVIRSLNERADYRLYALLLVATLGIVLAAVKIALNYSN